jgi:uncharacterized repeat protein (TIGR01451 family)
MRVKNFNTILGITVFAFFMLFQVSSWAQFTVNVVNGIATATFMPIACSPAVPVIDWGDVNSAGDPCITVAPDPGVQHQYQTCGTFTVVYKCAGLNTPAIYETNVNINIPTLIITKLAPEIVPTACGDEVLLKMQVSRDPVCGEISGTINVNSMIPANFTPVGDSPFTINSNNVSLSISGASITTTPTTYTLRLQPKLCTLNINSKITFNLTGPLGIGFGMQPCTEIQEPITQSSATLEWNNVPSKTPCLKVQKTTLIPFILAGGTALFQVSVQNIGSAAASNVKVSDVIPAGFSIVSSPPNSSVAGNTISTTVSTIAAGQTWTGTYTLQHILPVPFDPCAPPVSFTNCATAEIVNCNNTSVTSCSVVEVVTAVLPPNPNFTTNEVDCNTFQFVSGDTGPGLTHSWTFGDGSPMETIANPTHNYINDGTYIVTHTVTRCGLTNTQTFTISIKCISAFVCPCTSAGSLNIVAGAGTLVSSIPELSSPGEKDLDNFGNCIAIQGRLIIDIPIAIRDGADGIPGTIRMQPGALVQVNGLKALTIYNSDIVGCGQMWRSILVSPRGVLRLRNNNISDAEYAVNVRTGVPSPFSPLTDISIVGNRFFNNHVAIQLLQQNSLIHIIEKNSFSTDLVAGGNLLPPWSDILPHYSSTRGYVGIAAFNRALSSRNNRFFNLRNGIMSENCDYFTIFEQFSAIVGTPSINPSFLNGSAGIGVLVINGKITSSQNIFNKLHTGIYADGNPIVANSNSFSGVRRGIFGLRTRSADIYRNSMNTFSESGITLASLIPNGDPYKIYNNSLVSSGGNTSFEDHEWGISVSDVTESVAGNAFVSFNLVDIFDNTGGIRLRNVTNWIVGSENIHTYAGESNAPTNVPGFRFENGGSNYIYRNFSIGNSKNDGYQTFLSGSNIFCCNEATRADAGFLFMGTCLGTNFRINQISSTNNCLRFKNMTRISPQPDRANRFLEGSGFALHEGSITDINQSKFFINDLNMNDLADSGDSPWFPSSGATTGLFVPSNLINENTCLEDIVCVDPEVPERPKIEEQDYLLIGNRPDTTVLGSTQHWESQRYLYHKLRQNPELLGEDAGIDYFYEAQQVESGVLGRYAEMETKINQLNTIPTIWAERLNVITDSVARYHNLAADQLTLLSAFSTIEDSLNAHYVANAIEQGQVPWLLESDSLKQLAEVWQRNEARLLLPLIEALPDAQTAMHNRKAALLAYARYRAVGIPDLNSPEVQELGAIALQCPLEGGSAVYIARELYSAFGGVQDYNDLQICNVQERGHFLESLRTSLPIRLRVVPNPAHDRCTLSWDTPAEFEGLVRIWGSDGRLIYQQVVSSGSSGIAIETAAFNSGLYYCQYIQSGNQVLNATLSVQH